MNKPVDPELLSPVVMDHGQWQANLRLQFARRERGVRLVRCEHKGPLYVQKAFYPEGPDCAHAYLLHPPGGLVTGDVLSIEVDTGESTHALITTPGAGRVYRAREAEGAQTQNLTLNVSDKSILEWLPLENILFPGSHARMNTRIELADTAQFIGWEITCFGLPANKLVFEKGSVDQSMQIWQGGKIRFNERLCIDDSAGFGDDEGMNDKRSFLTGNAAMQSLPVHGLMVAGPFDEYQESLIADIRSIETSAGLLATTQVGEFVTIRYLGECTEKARKLLTQAWAKLRPALIEKDVVEPRIWRT